MIPYFQWMMVYIGPVSVHVWGLMVALGIVVGLLLAVRIVKQKGLNPEVMWDVAFWVILSALLGSRILYVASEFALYSDHPLDVFKVWQGGMSFSGGLLGAAIAGWVYFRRHKHPWREYVESGIMALPLGIAIGRLGCFFIFDHPGVATTFFLGQRYVDGIVRHNHGLYLSLEEFILAVVFLILWKRNPHRKTGFYTSIFLLWYGTIRFLLDFLRAADLPNSDSRYLGLTVAQYAALLVVVGGCILWYSLTHGIRTKTQTSKEKEPNKKGRS